MGCICEECGKEYTYKRNLGGTKSYCASCLTTKRRKKLKRKIVEYMGGKCIVCGYNKCYGALTTHHVNEKDKSFNISGSECRAWSKITEELKKCVLLCANCHLEYHHNCTEHCDTYKQKFELIEYNFPKKCPTSYYTVDGRSKDPKYNRTHGTRKDYANNIIKKNLEKNKPKVDILLQANIDYTKYGWVSKASKIINIAPQKTRSWIKRNIPELLENAYKR